MYKHILIATDGSELAGRALAHGLALAKELKAPVTVVGKANLDPVHQFEDMAGPHSNPPTTATTQLI